MAVPNLGPELPDASGADDRRANPARVYRDEHPLDEFEAASTRASSVTHRFGGTRYGLSRPAPRVDPPTEGGESDPQD